MEWAVTELACNAYSMVLVPLYDTLGPDAVKYIVGQVKRGTMQDHDNPDGGSRLNAEQCIIIGQSTRHAWKCTLSTDGRVPMCRLS